MPDDSDDLAAFLGAHPPFDDLDAEQLGRLARAAHTRRFADGTQILDAFATESDEMYVVLEGRVDLWNSRGSADPDERLGPGGVFGYSALLTQRPVGPRAVARGSATVAILPGDIVTPALQSSGGARFLADSLSRRPPDVDPSYGVVDELITRTPLLVAPDTSVADVAQRMTEADTYYAAIELGDGRFGIVTDRVLRTEVIVPRRPLTTPVSEVMQPALTTASGESAAGALITLLDEDAEFLLIVDRAGRLRGAAAPADFAVSSTTAGVALREQISRAGDADELADRAAGVPGMVADLLTRGLATSKVTAVYTATVDAIVRRALVLVFAQHDDLDIDAFTWLELGGNGRREAVLSSDVDSAVTFSGDLDPAQYGRYRSAFAEVEKLLVRAGLHVDEHGATASRAAFSRTNAQWRSAAKDWLDDPVPNQGAIMTSLLVDGRPVHGDPGLPEVLRVFGDLRSHPGTMKLLLEESLSKKARLRSVRDVLARRGGTFDVKTHALLPIVNIARWAALTVGSSEVQTTERLRAASGSPMLADGAADTLIEVFEVLQQVRLRHQLAQRERGHRPSDVVTMHRLSPIDRSVIGQAVREVSTVQRRMANLAQYTSSEEW
ncbi:putative nucleotidyltransferase substrate binding domain-containing protein [Jatrophihabitans fulvus]